ncbi:hypothetical protein J3R83DRAFT_14084 [Lanmaoa asiatica]|nr:hypothetical protein J3R83DRAFT_14084 [Lanmaoa asiatica]
MSAEDRQELPSLNAAGKSNNVSLIRPNPVTSNSYSLEDGEVEERRFSSIASRPLLQQPKDKPQLHLSNQDRASSSFPTAEPVASLASTVEPMTKEDLDRAKSLVLDLLGWGVTPEYLVDCGLSQGAVHRIFTDLRLRLPRNLEALPPPLPHHGAR